MILKGTKKKNKKDQRDLPRRTNAGQEDLSNCAIMQFNHNRIGVNNFDNFAIELFFFGAQLVRANILQCK